jgi:TP901 family phage tail tape measure protein
MDSNVGFNLQFNTNGNSVLQSLNNGLNAVNDNTKKVTKTFGDCYKTFMAFELVSNNLSQVKDSFNNLLSPGITLNTQMSDLSAITGLTGTGLKEIEKAARDSAKTFGTDASQNVNSYKLILSQLSPEIAKSSVAMKLMGNNVNILSKTMGGDTVAATEVLTTAMNQYGVNLDNPIQASKVMSDMMNVMAAGAKEGSAELPQIKQALEQVGMVAKTTGVSFVATNAAIQMLDKAGKKGSEGGVALRNVLTTLSEGRFASKDATVGLQQMGISTTKLADASIPLTDRLRMLKPVMGDTALMTKVFGKENMAGAIALIESADAQDVLAKKLTGTNTAVEQANTVMGSYQERMNRWQAVFTDVKIGFFNVTQSIAPFVSGFLEGVSVVSEFANTSNQLYSIYESKLIPKMWRWIVGLFTNTGATIANTRSIAKNTFEKLKAAGSSTTLSISTAYTSAMMLVGAVAARIQASGLRSVAASYGMATIGATAFKIAMDALGFGLIITAIVLLIAGLKYLWENSKRFREILFGVWEAAKAVFHNIGVVIKRVWDMIVKPIINAYYTVFKFVFTKIWEFIKWVFNGIASVFVWLYDQAVAVFTMVKDFVVGVFNWIVEKVSGVLSFVGSFFSGLWDWFSSVFSGFIKFIDEWLIQPIKNAFSSVWDWIVGIFEKIMDKLTGIFAPIKKFFKSLFSSEGMTDVKAAYKDGEKKGAASFDKDKKEEAEKKKAEKAGDKTDKNAFDVTKGFQNGALPATKPIAGVGGKEKKESGSGGGSGSRSITIGKLIENMTLHFHGTVKESKESIRQSITEVLVTSVNDINLAN